MDQLNSAITYIIHGTAAAIIVAVCCCAQPDVPTTEPAREFREVPQLGITLPCKVLSVHDGDTLKVECRFTMDIRLLDCWAPELSGADRLAGFKSRDNLKAIAEGKTGIVSVPLTSDNIGKATSMSRVLGRVLINGDDVGYLQVQGGFATKTKEAKEKPE